jgi:very-short-patch-repair endonuclease
MPETQEQRAMAAVLDAGPGAVVSHQSAAALWGLAGFNLEKLEVSRPREGGNRPTTLAELHHPRSLPLHHCTRRHQLPVTTLVRTVFDLAGSEYPARAEGALHSALRAGLRWATVREHLDEVAGKGRPGIRLMRELLAAHGDRPVLGSGLEARFLRVLRDVGLPEPRRQVDVGADSWIGRVDFLYEDVRLVIEVNGGWAHTSSMDVERDHHRTARLVAAGYTVLPVPEQLIRERPAEVGRLVREARRRAA